MSSLLRDIRYSVRMLGKNRGVTVAIVLTLSLGIGANTTIFSWINSTLLNPIPGATNTRDLMAFAQKGEGFSKAPCSYPDYRDLRERNSSFTDLLACNDYWMTLTGDRRPERVYGALTSANYFDVLGVRPVLGRGFLPSEEKQPGGAPVAVISYGLWQTRYAGDSSVLGKTIHVNRHTYTIIGVTGPGFHGGTSGLRMDLWIPLAMVEQVWGGDRLDSRESIWLDVIGRLRPGVSAERAQKEITALVGQLVERYPESHQYYPGVVLEPLWRSQIGVNSLFSSLLPMLLGLSGVVLLLACANVATLVLVRSVTRRREVALRVSLGAKRWHLVRQLLVEYLLLALLGGCVAFLVTAWTAETLAYFLPPFSAPVLVTAPVDRTVLLATASLSALAAVFFGVLPAIRSSKVSPSSVLKEGAASVTGAFHKSRLTRTLVVVQVSLSLLLLVCAGLFVRSFNAAQDAHPGFDRDGVLLATYDLLPAGYSDAEGLEFTRQLLTKLKSVSGVESATVADAVPLCFRERSATVTPEGYTPGRHEAIAVASANVGPDYLRTMRIPLISGRDLSWLDDERSRLVVVVNQAFAERYWPGQEPLGRRIFAGDTAFTVVGVAANCKWTSLREAAQPFIYVPFLQSFNHEATVHVRVFGDPLSFRSALENSIGELNRDLPIYEVLTLHQQSQTVASLTGIAGVMVGLFGLLALLIATVGIYGLVAYSSRQRTREIGIRMALGACRANVVRLVLAQGMRLVFIGFGLGLALALGLTPLLRSQLLGVGPTDFVTFGAASFVLLLVSFAACYIPARRASKLEPMTVLRGE